MGSMYSLPVPTSSVVAGYPWLAAKCPPSCSLTHSSFSVGQGKQIGWKISWVFLPPLPSWTQTAPPPAWAAQGGWGRLASVHSSFLLLPFPSHTVTLLQHGLSMGCSVNTCSRSCCTSSSSSSDLRVLFLTLFVAFSSLCKKVFFFPFS